MSSIARRIATMGASDADVRLWIAAVIANGGSVSKARASIIDRFVAAEKASGAWALTDDYWGLWGGNAPQALTSLKQRRLAVAVNSPTFAADRGYTGDGGANYINTGYIANSHAVALTVNSARIATYQRLNLADNGYVASGLGASTNYGFRLRPRSASSIFLGAANIAAFSSSIPNTDSKGLHVFSRDGAAGAVGNFYKNGALYENVTPGTFGIALTTTALCILVLNFSGALSSYSSQQVGFVIVGAALSAAQELAQYNAVQRWATDIGAQV